MTEENLRYSREDLAEFDQIIQDKLTAARKELSFIRETLTRNNESGTDTTAASLKVLEDGAETNGASATDYDHSWDANASLSSPNSSDCAASSCR